MEKSQNKIDSREESVFDRIIRLSKERKDAFERLIKAIDERKEERETEKTLKERKL